MADVEIRPFRSEDEPAAYALVAEHQKELFGEAELSEGMFSNLVAIADASYTAETAAGFAGSGHIRAGGIDVQVCKPERRRGIGTRLLRALEEGAQADVLRLVAVTLEPAAAPFCVANGYEKAWEVWLMGIDLADSLPPPRWPEDVIVRTFRDEDAAEIKELLDLAYAQEAHHQPLPFEDWRTLSNLASVGRVWERPFDRPPTLLGGLA